MKKRGPGWKEFQENKDRIYPWEPPSAYVYDQTARYIFATFKQIFNGRFFELNKLQDVKDRFNM